MNFTDSPHQYDKDGVIYTPVSDLIDIFVPEFEKDKISKAIANRDDRKQEEVLKEWDLKREIGCNWGDSFHKSAELALKYDEMPKQKPLQDFVNALYTHIDKDRCESEKMVWNDNLRVAGTIDIVERLSEPDREEKRGKVRLLDIKTNTDFEKSYDKMLAPFDEYESNKINKYTLQLNFYKELIEGMEDVKVEEMGILKLKYEDGIDVEFIEIEEVEEDLLKIIEELNLKVEYKEENLIERFI